MDTDRLNKWLSLVANLGVIAGIVFLAYEIRLSNQIALATTELTLRESYGSANESVYENPAIAEVLHKARNTDSEFSGAESQMAEYYIARMFNTWVGIELAYDNGMASRETLEAAFADMRWTYDYYPALRHAWRD